MTADAINAASLAFKKALIGRALGGEKNHHLGYPPGVAKPPSVTNQRNGRDAKTVLTDDRPIRIEVQRDRNGSFEPLLIPKQERCFAGFDDKIIAMYARGMTVREIQGFVLEQCGTEVSPEFISLVTDEVMSEVAAWQSRPLEPMYPVVFFDALHVTIREDAVVRNWAVFSATTLQTCVIHLILITLANAPVRGEGRRTAIRRCAVGRAFLRRCEPGGADGACGRVAAGVRDGVERSGRG